MLLTCVVFWVVMITWVAAGNQLCVYNVVSHSNMIDAELRQGENKYENHSVQYVMYIIIIALYYHYSKICLNLEHYFTIKHSNILVLYIYI